MVPKYWIFENAFWNLSWGEIFILTPFAIGLLIKFILWRRHGKPCDNPERQVGGNDNINSNFHDYM